MVNNIKVVIIMVGTPHLHFLLELSLPKEAVVVHVFHPLVVPNLVFLVMLMLLHHKVDLVVEVDGNLELVPHLTKAHTLVGHLTETLVVTEQVEKTMLLLVVVELVELVKIQLQPLEVLVV